MTDAADTMTEWASRTDFYSSSSFPVATANCPHMQSKAYTYPADVIVSP